MPRSFQGTDRNFQPDTPLKELLFWSGVRYGLKIIPALYPLPFNGGRLRQSLLTNMLYQLSVCCSRVYFSNLGRRVSPPPGSLEPIRCLLLSIIAFYFLAAKPIKLPNIRAYRFQPATPKGTSSGCYTEGLSADDPIISVVNNTGLLFFFIIFC